MRSGPGAWAGARVGHQIIVENRPGAGGILEQLRVQIQSQAAKRGKLARSRNSKAE